MGPRSRSRLSHPRSGSTLSGLAAPSSPHCPPSKRCGSPKTSTTSLARASCTASASKQRKKLPVGPRTRSPRKDKNKTAPKLLLSHLVIFLGGIVLWPLALRIPSHRPRRVSRVATFFSCPTRPTRYGTLRENNRRMPCEVVNTFVGLSQ